MAYDLRAVIADGELLRGGVGELPAARLASIGQGLSLMPVTDELFDSVADGGGAGPLGLWGLPGGFEKTLAAWSAGGLVAYVEAKYFGGEDEFAAVGLDKHRHSEAWIA
ncbi:hypothetical protein [Streptomyces griseosporeus]|uniref:hypothetical protein n=1 Tax=Streptomyces griseosporeus TaxID=1910 RepID=UPI0036FCFB48